MEFPSVSGTNLLRQTYRLPEDLEGEINLLFVPFQQWQQEVVDSWVPFATRLEASYPGFRYYELPTIKKMNMLARTFINEGMRVGIPDQRSRERTITLYLDKDKFRRALGIPTENDVSIYLIDRSGNILAHSSGIYSEEKGRDLHEVVESHFQSEVKL